MHCSFDEANDLTVIKLYDGEYGSSTEDGDAILDYTPEGVLYGCRIFGLAARVKARGHLVVDKDLPRAFWEPIAKAQALSFINLNRKLMDALART